jgi:hypothetical protein
MSDRLKGLAQKLAALVGIKGRDGQRKRYEIRREALKIETGRDYFATRHKPNGAFGRCKAVIDPRPALWPDQMRAMEAAKG